MNSLKEPNMLSSAILDSKDLMGESLILQSTFHLNYGKHRIRTTINKGIKSNTLESLVENIHRPGIFKRIFVDNPENGYRYITASIMTNHNPTESAKFISKKYTPWIDTMMLRKGEILVSCAGTIGNVRIITSDLSNCIGSQDIIRVVPKKDTLGFIYALLSSPTYNSYLQAIVYGSVVSRLDPETLKKIPVPNFRSSLISRVNALITDTIKLREDANNLLTKANQLLFEKTQLRRLKKDDYEFFGNHTNNRLPSCFSISINEVSSKTINAFNYSEKIGKLKAYIKRKVKCQKLYDVLSDDKFFSTGSFPRLELNTVKSIKLINQSDIFNIIKTGKKIARKSVPVNNLVSYGEVLIAGVGTLGENETFCRVVFADKELEGQLVSGEFIRMKTHKEVPSGFLYAWLSSEYGFRMIRNTHTGTKLCRPIQSLLKNIPVPILDFKSMKEIHDLIIKAHEKRFEALTNETEAIKIIEKEIESWQR